MPSQRHQRAGERVQKVPVMVIKDVRVLDLAVLVPLMRDPAINLQIVPVVSRPPCRA